MSGKKQSQANRPSPARSSSQPTDFNFDEWAVEVRQQMIEALKRRGSV